MEFLQMFDSQFVFYGAICLSGLCVLGIVLSVVMPLLGLGFDIFFSVLGFMGEVVAGGPMAWCGCFVLLFGMCACGGLVLMIAAIVPECGTADAVNLCRFIGY